MKLKLIAKLVCLSLAVTMISCATKSRDEAYSSVTGWKYNDKKGTGFSVKKDYKTQAPLGMVAIEGGTYTIGERGEFVTAPRNNPRRSSFWQNCTEISRTFEARCKNMARRISLQRTYLGQLF
jgi:sulfatase modifying factor 1